MALKASHSWPVVVLPSSPNHLSLVKVIASMIISTNIGVNRMDGWLEDNTWKYARGESVIVGGRCGLGQCMALLSVASV
jgi:hypothetical protein